MAMLHQTLLVLLLCLGFITNTTAEDGYRLWLRDDLYAQQIKGVVELF